MRPTKWNTQRERYDMSVAVMSPDECWLWTRCRCGNNGYGVITWDGRKQAAHRVAWQIACGPIPDGLSVLHACDNPVCCNPAHLFLGTHIDNMADMKAKGRGRSGGRMNAKLTESQVIEARRRYTPRSPTDGVHALAREYGVAYATMREAIAGKTWAR